MRIAPQRWVKLFKKLSTKANARWWGLTFQAPPLLLKRRALIRGIAMTDQPKNDQFHDTSFLEGQNGEYLEGACLVKAEQTILIGPRRVQLFHQRGKIRHQTVQIGHL